MTTRTTDLPDTWAYGAGILHGGWLLETLAAEALDAVGQQHPVAVSAHYVASPKVGASDLVTEVLREGRSVATVRTSLVQEGRTKVEALVSCGSLPDPATTPRLLDAAPPPLPPVEQCLESRGPVPGERNGITDNLEIRLDPATAGFATGSPSGSAEVRGWVRLRSGRQPDPLMLLTVADALPPVTFDMGLVGWVPTVELTVLVRGVPAPGWLAVVQRARLVHAGWLDEECEVWDSEGRLVAQARQLAMYREPAQG